MHLTSSKFKVCTLMIIKCVTFFLSLSKSENILMGFRQFNRLPLSCILQQSFYCSVYYDHIVNNKVPQAYTNHNEFENTNMSYVISNSNFFKKIFWLPTPHTKIHNCNSILGLRFTADHGNYLLLLVSLVIRSLSILPNLNIFI